MIYLQKNKSTYIDIYTNQKKGREKGKEEEKEKSTELITVHCSAGTV